jgi:hypothetical protein
LRFDRSYVLGFPVIDTIADGPSVGLKGRDVPIADFCPLVQRSGRHSKNLRVSARTGTIKHIVNRPYPRPGCALTEKLLPFQALRDGSTALKYVKNSSKTC